MKTEKIFTKTGKHIKFIHLKNDNVELDLIDIGASIYSLKIKNKEGKLENIVLNYADLDQYFKNSSYFGATIGRVAGRIKNGFVKLKDKEYFINKLDSEKNVLHGGCSGISFKRFNVELLSKNKVKFSLLQRQTDDGFPADVNIYVSYTLKENNLLVEYNATTTSETILSLTNHSYFNLSGNAKDNILDCTLEIPANGFIETDEELLPVKNVEIIKPLDFRKEYLISDKFKDDYYKTAIEGGIDHIFEVNDITVLKDTKSGRKLSITSSYPAMVIYTTNYPDGSILADTTQEVKKYQGICFEAQHLPNLADCYDNYAGRFDNNHSYNHFISYDFDVY